MMFLRLSLIHISRIVKSYDGSDIVLNEELGIKMGVHDFACLQEKIGEDLIVTDGTTLLGADDKAGIAEIMTMAETPVSYTHLDVYKRQFLWMTIAL